VRLRRGQTPAQGVDEVGADAFELRDPGDDGVRLGGSCMSRMRGRGIEIVLDAEELEGVAAIAVDEFTLHFCGCQRIGM